MFNTIKSAGERSKINPQAKPYSLKRIIPAFPLLFFVSFVGCGLFSVQSPRPNTKQIEAAKDISEKNVPTIANLQLSKQNQIASVARAAIHEITKNPEQVVALTNITANAFKAIKDSDGTAKILGTTSQIAMKDILTMSVPEYLAYTAAQGMMAAENREVAYKGLETGFKWGKTHTGLAISLATILFGGGIGGKILSNIKSNLTDAQQTIEDKSLLLTNTGSAIESWKKDNPDGWKTLKPILTDAHSTVPLNVKSEFGLS